MQARITKSSLLAAPRSLVYRDKNSCHWVQGFPSNEGVEWGYPLKRRHFAVIVSRDSDDEGRSGCLLTYPARIPTDRLNCGKKIGEEERGVQLSLRGLSPGDRR